MDTGLRRRPIDGREQTWVQQKSNFQTLQTFPHLCSIRAQPSSTFSALYEIKTETQNNSISNSIFLAAYCSLNINWQAWASLHFDYCCCYIIIYGRQVKTICWMSIRRFPLMPIKKQENNQLDSFWIITAAYYSEMSDFWDRTKLFLLTTAALTARVTLTSSLISQTCNWRHK